MVQVHDAHVAVVTVRHLGVHPEVRLAQLEVILALGTNLLCVSSCSKGRLVGGLGLR